MRLFKTLSVLLAASAATPAMGIDCPSSGLSSAAGSNNGIDQFGASFNVTAPNELDYASSSELANLTETASALTGNYLMERGYNDASCFNFNEPSNNTLVFLTVLPDSPPSEFEAGLSSITVGVRAPIESNFTFLTEQLAQLFINLTHSVTQGLQPTIDALAEKRRRASAEENKQVYIALGVAGGVAFIMLCALAALLFLDHDQPAQPNTARPNTVRDLANLEDSLNAAGRTLLEADNYDDCKCSISTALMHEPVQLATADGTLIDPQTTYEKSNIERWFASCAKPHKHPGSNARLPVDYKLVVNEAIKEKIAALLRNHSAVPVETVVELPVSRADGNLAAPLLNHDALRLPGYGSAR